MSVAVRRLSAGRTVSQLLVASAGLGVIDSVLKGAPTPPPPLYAPSVPLRPPKPPSEVELRNQPPSRLLARFYSTNGGVLDDPRLTEPTLSYYDTGPVLKPLEPNPKKRKGGDLEGNTQKHRSNTRDLTGNYTTAMKLLLKNLTLSVEVMGGIVAHANASEAVVPNGGVELSASATAYAQANEIFTKIEELLFRCTHLSPDDVIFELGKVHRLQQFLGLVPVAFRKEKEALTADLAGQCVDAPKDQDYYNKWIELALLALNGDAVGAQRAGGRAALVYESVPQPLIKVAVRLVPDEDRAVVAHMLAAKRLAFLEETSLEDDSSRACPCCGTVCGSARDALWHLMRSSPLCGWELLFSKMDLPYCRGCKNPACDRMKGGKRPFVTERSRNNHEQGYGRNAALLREGFVPGDVVLVDYSGGQERGVFVDAGTRGSLIVNFDDPALGQKSFRYSYTVTKVDDPTVTHTGADNRGAFCGDNPSIVGKRKVLFVAATKNKMAKQFGPVLPFKKFDIHKKEPTLDDLAAYLRQGYRERIYVGTHIFQQCQLKPKSGEDGVEYWGWNVQNMHPGAENKWVFVAVQEKEE